MGACLFSKYLSQCDQKNFEKMSSSFSHQGSPSNSGLFLNNLDSDTISPDKVITKSSLNNIYPKIENKNNTKQLDNFIKEMLPVVKSILMKE